MAQALDKLVEHQVQVLTCDGRIFQGFLKSFDQRLNVILQDTVEHVYKSDQEPMEMVETGAYFMRGDNVAVISKVEMKLT